MGLRIWARIFARICSGKIAGLDFWAQDFTSKFEVKICAYEVLIRAYEVKSCAYEVNIYGCEVKIHASEVKSWARKSRNGSSLRILR